MKTATGRSAGLGARRGLAVALLALLSGGAAAQTNAPQVLDLATVLRLAGANSLEVKLAGERLREAQAKSEEARLRQFPWIAPGIGYKRHEGRTQNVEGELLDASKQAYSLGLSLTANLDLGQARYEALAARQRANAAAAGVDIRRQDVTLSAASGYFDLLRAQGSIGAAREAVRIADEYAEQVRRAASAGLAFAGDVARADVQVERNRQLLRQAEELRAVAAARLATTLRLPANSNLAATETELVPMAMNRTDTAMEALMAEAVAARPELRQLAAQHAAAVESVRGERDARAIPNLSAQVFAGGIGGGTGGDFGDFGDSTDASIALSWRFGPGGYFDKGRIAAAESRERSSQFEQEQSRDAIMREVVEAHARVTSLSDQLASSARALAAAERLYDASRARREFGVAVVLEAVQAEQELTRARLDRLALIAEHNKAQFALHRVLGASTATWRPIP